jgi:hypothetical protein
MDDQRPRQQGLVHVRGNPFTVPGQRNPILQTQPSQERLSREEEERRRVKETEKVLDNPSPLPKPNKNINHNASFRVSYRKAQINSVLFL